MFFVLFSNSLSKNSIKFNNGELHITADSSYTRAEIDAVTNKDPVSSIIIDGTYDEIPTAAFAGLCVDTIRISAPIRVINSLAFSKTKLRDFTVPETCQVIGTDCFRHCTQLTTFYYRKITMTIKANAFYECTLLSEFRLANGDTTAPVEGMRRTFGARVFFACKSLSVCELQDDTVELGQRMFVGSGIENFKIPASLKKIPNFCFTNSRISSADLMNIEAIGIQAFSGCTKLETIKVSEKLEQIHSGAFSGCVNAVFCGLEKANYMFDTYAFAGIVSIKEFTLPPKMYSIPAGAFKGCPYLTKINYNDHTYQIWEHAYFETAITDAKLPKILNWAAPGAFAGMHISTFNVNANPNYDIDLDGKLLSNPGKTVIYGFAPVNSPLSISLPSSYTIIGPYAFYGCQSLMVAIGEETATICGYAFQSCRRMETFITSTMMNTLQEGVFAECDSLKTVAITGVKEIKDAAFRGCKNLVQVMMDGVQVIRDEAFRGCNSFEQMITTCNKISYIGKYAFSGTSYQYIIFPASLQVLESLAVSESTLKRIIFTGNVTLNAYALTNKNLESVTFRTNAGKINKFAFFAPTVQYMIYCGDKRPQGADLYQNTHPFDIYTTKAFKDEKFMGSAIKEKWDYCLDILPPTPTLEPTTAAPQPDNADMKKILIVESIVCGIVIFGLLIVIIVLFVLLKGGNKYGEPLNSTPLLTQQ